MVYLTSGLLDNYENQDTELETTIVKVSLFYIYKIFLEMKILQLELFAAN